MNKWVISHFPDALNPSAKIIDDSVTAKYSARQLAVLGFAFFWNKDPLHFASKCFHYCKLAADRQDTLGQFYTGFSYQTGRGVAADLKEAETYFEKAAKNEFFPAYTGLGYLNDNNTQGLYYYEIAAKNGHPLIPCPS